MGFRHAEVEIVSSHQREQRELHTRPLKQHHRKLTIPSLKTNLIQNSLITRPMSPNRNRWKFQDPVFRPSPAIVS